MEAGQLNHVPTFSIAVPSTTAKTFLSPKESSLNEITYCHTSIENDQITAIYIQLVLLLINAQHMMISMGLCTAARHH